MYAAVLHGVGDLRYETVAQPITRPGTVKIRVRACGICGGDIPRVYADAAYHFPIILGHEFSGDVAEVGEGVDNLQVGDRVAGAALLPCHRCDDCARGDFGACRQYSFAGSWVDGAFCDYIVLPAQNAVPLAPSITYEQAALLEPCTVALHGMRRARLQGGSTVAIVGAGTIGLFAVQWAKALGAQHVTAVDVDGRRLEAAREYGADTVLRSDTDDWREQAQAITDRRGFDYVFDTAGQPKTVPLCMELAAVAGTVCYIGYPTADFTMPHQVFHQINRKELQLIGSQMSYGAPFPGKDWTMAAACIAQGKIRCDEGLIGCRLPMSQAAEAFALARQGATAGRVILYNE